MNGNGKQGELDEIIIQQKQVKIKALACELERRLKDVAFTVPRDKLATLNDKSYSYMSDILNTNGEETQKPYQVKLIPSLCIENPDLFKEQVIDFFCDLCGYEPPHKKLPMTAEQQIEEFRKKVREHKLDSIFKDIL